jgi:hypothetical protein
MEGIDWTLTWVTVQAIATCVLAVGIGIAVWQVRETRKSTAAQFAIDLSRKLHEIGRKTFLLVYCVLCEDDVLKDKRNGREISESSRITIGNIIDHFELLGTLVAHGIIDKKIAINLFKGPVIRYWSRLEPLVKRRREIRGYYSKYFEYFTKQCVKYQIEHDPTCEWVKIQINDEPYENLIEKLQVKLLSNKELTITKFNRSLRSFWNHALREKS